jgi:putative SOS response-associated peptidase YedK
VVVSAAAPFAFADLWLPGQGDGPPTAASITTQANEFMQPIHEPMPVILEPEDERLWLDPALTETEAVLPLLRPGGRRAVHAARIAVSTPRRPGNRSAASVIACAAGAGWRVVTEPRTGFA